MTEFAFNVVIFISTRLFAFMTNYEFESGMFFDLSAKNSQTSTRERVLTRRSAKIINKMSNV